MSRILVAGIGNIFHRDDGFGVTVAAELKGIPDNVRVVDFGIRGFDLMLSLLDGYDLVVFVDTIQRGGPAGSLYKIEPTADDIPDIAEPGGFSNAHGLDPLKVLTMAKNLGAPSAQVIVIGCEPETLGDDSGVIGLSGPVQAAVAPAIEMIHAVIRDFSRQETGTAFPSERVIQ